MLVYCLSFVASVLPHGGTVEIENKNLNRDRSIKKEPSNFTKMEILVPLHF